MLNYLSALRKILSTALDVAPALRMRPELGLGVIRVNAPALYTALLNGLRTFDPLEHWPAVAAVLGVKETDWPYCQELVKLLRARATASDEKRA